MYACMYVNKQTNQQTKTANNQSAEKDETVMTIVWDKKVTVLFLYLVVPQ